MTLKNWALLLLVPKKGDPLDPKNKRPITLLNVHYKVLAKTLSSRLAWGLSCQI